MIIFFHLFYVFYSHKVQGSLVNIWCYLQSQVNALAMFVRQILVQIIETGDGPTDPLCIIPLFLEVECYFCTAADF